MPQSNLSLVSLLILTLVNKIMVLLAVNSGQSGSLSSLSLFFLHFAKKKNSMWKKKLTICIALTLMFFLFSFFFSFFFFRPLLHGSAAADPEARFLWSILQLAERLLTVAPTVDTRPGVPFLARRCLLLKPGSEGKTPSKLFATILFSEGKTGVLKPSFINCRARC